MRKILWLYFLRQESIQMIKIFLWYLLIYILMERGSGALFFYILIQWGKWDGGKKDIPKSMVILPFHGKERKKFTEKKILGKILLETMIHGLFLLFATIERKKKFFLFITSTEGIFLYMLVLIQLISCIHLMEYYDYMKKTNAWYTEMLGMMVIVKAILIWSSFYMEGMLFTVYIVPWLLAAVGLHYGDYKIVKKHFNNMINFYADYEYSRGIKSFQL